MNVPFETNSLSGVSRFQIANCVSALRWIFVGQVLCAFFIRSGRVDLLDNSVGMVLIVVGLSNIARLPVTGKFKSGADFALYVAWVGLVHSIVTRFQIRWQQPFTMVRELVNCAYPIAMFLFCQAMRDFCRQAKLYRSTSSWQVTTWLITIIYVVPLLIIHGFTLIYSLDGRTFSWNVRGDAVFVVIGAMIVPLVHFFISTSRMKREGIWGMR